MIMTKAILARLRNGCRWRVSTKLAGYLLDELGTEPYPYEFSEQDLLENAGRLVTAYNTGTFKIPSIRARYRKLLDRYNNLQRDYIELALLYRETAGRVPKHLDHYGMTPEEIQDGEEEEENARF